jgi:F-type H+-transporting ATPase subunit b
MSTEVLIDALPEIVTQLFGFLVVFFILKKYAFGTILNLIDERRKSIADSFASIENQKKEMDNLQAEYRLKMKQIEDTARKKIQEAVEEGSRIARQIKDKAREDSLKQLERAKADIQQETVKAKAVLRRDFVEVSTKMAERILQKNLTAPDDEAFIEQILKETQEV